MDIFGLKLKNIVPNLITTGNRKRIEDASGNPIMSSLGLPVVTLENCNIRYNSQSLSPEFYMPSAGGVRIIFIPYSDNSLSDSYSWRVSTNGVYGTSVGQSGPFTAYEPKISTRPAGPGLIQVNTAGNVSNNVEGLLVIEVEDSY